MSSNWHNWCPFCCVKLSCVSKNFLGHKTDYNSCFQEWVIKGQGGPRYLTISWWVYSFSILFCPFCWSWSIFWPWLKGGNFKINICQSWCDSRKFSWPWKRRDLKECVSTLILFQSLSLANEESVITSVMVESHRTRMVFRRITREKYLVERESTRPV